jgi:sterol desaturase/sphingolipid hydroxylase (fatty acid hydroxylase superfamily)
MSQIQSLFIELLRLCLWLVILAAIFVPLERLFAVRSEKIFRAAFLQDLGYYFFNGVAAAIILAIPIGWAIVASHALIPASYLAWVDALPLWIKIAATVVVGEIGFYWGHRWSHEWGPLWYFHAVHHEPTHLDWLVNTRASPVDIVFTRICGLAPVYFLGLGNPSSAAGQIGPVLLVLGGTVWSFFIHANLRWHLGWFEQILSSPRFHHWHHARVGPINRNYSPMLPVIDRIFGTLHLPARDWPERYGILDSSDRSADPRPEPAASKA